MLDRLNTGWRPLSSLPRAGKFLIAAYSSKRGTFWVRTVRIRPEDPPHTLETALRGARAWMPLMPEPPEHINDPVGW